MTTPATPRDEAQVIIVGAGPTGLLLAGDLAAAGVRCTVLERRGKESNLTRAFAVHARTLEVLDARDLADELVATGQRTGAVRLFDTIAVDLSRLPTRFPYLLVTPQYHIERLLEGRARRLGAEIVRGAQVISVRQDTDGVDLGVQGDDGALGDRRAAYSVGADGVNSTVRRALDLDFPGHAAVQSVMLADVRLDQAPREVVELNAVAEGFAFIAPFGDGWYRLIAWDRRRQLPDDAPVTLDEVREITRLALGTDYGMHDARWLSRFHSDERQAPTYRSGRVFLAGDAAHVHSPAGGQGMNVGLQDAANLGWKLAADLHGWAPPGLLDSYNAERHPVGRSVLRNSGTLLRLAKLESRALRAGRAALLGAAMRVGPLSRRVAGRLSGVAVRYPSPRGAHRLVGTRAPDIQLSGDGGAPGQLYEALRTGRFALLAPSGDTDVTVDRWTDRVDRAAPAAAERRLTLVRPDGYVAWATDEEEPGRRAAALRAALTHWCGSPTEVTRAPGGGVSAAGTAPRSTHPARGRAR